MTAGRRANALRSATDRETTVADRLATAIDDLGFAVALAGPDGDVTFSNAAFTEIGATRVDVCDAVSAEPTAVMVRGHRLLRFTTTTGTLLVESLPAGDRVTGPGSRKALRRSLAGLLDDESDERVLLYLVRLGRLRSTGDTLGGDTGEALLRVACDRLESALGPRDRFFLTASDELAVIRERPGHDGSDLATRIVDLLGRTYLLDGQLLNLDIHVGVAAALPRGDTEEGLLRRAHLALAQAIEAGRAGYSIFAPEMDEQMLARRSLEIDLRRALALRELKLAYQPQLEIATERITGFEALLRWDHPERGLVPPAAFIPLAEETGLIVPIGGWVLRTACEEAIRWPEDIEVGVNVSAIQFGAPGLLDAVAVALTSTGLAPHRLELEITESVMLGGGAARETLAELRAMGVRVAMDDFGTGYSSLSALSSFHFDRIKIDQSFVRGRPDGRPDSAVVRAITALAKSMGMKTIAEGVETVDQMAQIAADGCTSAQGYLISRPMWPTAIPDFLSNVPSATTSDRVIGGFPNEPETTP